jgi:DNA-binding GntR family transcriptional regulator
MVIMEWIPEIPRWRQVYAAMEQRIRSGEYAPGERLPGILDIAAEWGIGEVTARRVLRELRQSGLAYMEPGIGTFASKGPQE